MPLRWRWRRIWSWILRFRLSWPFRWQWVGTCPLRWTWDSDVFSKITKVPKRMKIFYHYRFWGSNFEHLSLKSGALTTEPLGRPGKNFQAQWLSRLDYVAVHVEDVGDRFVLVLELEGLGHVKIVFHGLYYPWSEVSASGDQSIENSAISRTLHWKNML